MNLVIIAAIISAIIMTVGISLIITFIFRHIINKIAQKPMETEKKHAAMVLVTVTACVLTFVIAAPFALIPLCALGYHVIKLW